MRAAFCIPSVEWYKHLFIAFSFIIIQLIAAYHMARRPRSLLGHRSPIDRMLVKLNYFAYPPVVGSLNANGWVTYVLLEVHPVEHQCNRGDNARSLAHNSPCKTSHVTDAQSTELPQYATRPSSDTNNALYTRSLLLFERYT